MTTQTPQTIPADDFKLDGDRAWILTKRCRDERAPQAAHWGAGDPCHLAYRALDRPCDTCDGHDPDWDHFGNCPDCIDGRHTWNVQVESACDECNEAGMYFGPEWEDWDRRTLMPCEYCAGPVTFRVSVVPGTVLPIQDHNVWRLDPQLPAITAVMLRFMLRRSNETCDWVQLPPGARPGRFAALLNVERIAAARDALDKALLSRED